MTPSPSSMVELLPCPMCAGRMNIGQEPHDNGYVAGLYYLYHARDTQAGRDCRVDIRGHFESREQIILFWNTRASPIAAQEVDPVFDEVACRIAERFVESYGSVKWENLRDAVRAALQQAALRATPASSWMPIASAPKDETLILVGNFREPGWTFFQHVVYWNDTDLGTPEHPWRISDTDQGIHKDYPTHWQPLPAPPSATDHRSDGHQRHRREGMKIPKKCRWCSDDLGPDDYYDRLCEQCSGDVIYCSICKQDEHADDPCRHVFQDQWGQWNGSGAWTPNDNVHESFLGFLDAMPATFARDLRAAIQSKRFHTWLIAPLIGSGGLLEMHGMPWHQSRAYGDTILGIGESEDAGKLHDGYRWLVSLYDGRTYKANQTTVQWIDQWCYQRPENEIGRWADDGGPSHDRR